MDRVLKAVALFDKFAKEYQEKFMDISLYHDSLDIFCNNLPVKDASIIDLACGPGNITKFLLSKNPGYKILGIDLSERMIELAKINNPTASFMVMDCREINSFDQKFDAVMCGFCFPYLSREECIQLISDVKNLLSPSGIFYISTMEDDYSKSGYVTSRSGEQIYMNYHQEDYLVSALEENNFRIIDIRRKNYKNDKEENVVDIIIISERIKNIVNELRI